MVSRTSIVQYCEKIPPICFVIMMRKWYKIYKLFSRMFGIVAALPYFGCTSNIILWLVTTRVVFLKSLLLGYWNVLVSAQPPSLLRIHPSLSLDAVRERFPLLRGLSFSVMCHWLIDSLMKEIFACKDFLLLVCLPARNSENFIKLMCVLEHGLCESLGMRVITHLRIYASMLAVVTR